MKYFIDTEFIEWAGGIDLISIGIVCEDGRTFYAESSSFDDRNASDWVKENVLSKLKFWQNSPNKNTVFPYIEYLVSGDLAHYRKMTVFGPLSYIRAALEKFFNKDLDENPEFYAYYADYDWVVFCRIFGRMIDLPDHFPMYCLDLKQMMWSRELSNEWKKMQCPDPEGEHNALVDAEWNMKLYDELIEIEPKR